MTERGELHRAPTYQRKFRWDSETESRLIESILLGLPIPNVFVATNDDGTWEVVDGLQRVSTLLHFTTEDPQSLAELGKTDPLELEGLRSLPNFNGSTFRSLPPAIQMSFMKRGIGITALSDKSDPKTRFESFERLNRGAVALSPQEIRACIYEGPFNELLRELAGYPGFKSLLKLQKNDEANATREEQVLKYFAYSYNRENFGGAVNEFLSKFMEDHRDSGQIIELRQEFHSVVDFLNELIGGPFLRTNVAVTPKIELEACMVAVGDILRDGSSPVHPQENWLDDPQLVEASTGATNTRKKLRERIARARQLLTNAE